MSPSNRQLTSFECFHDGFVSSLVFDEVQNGTSFLPAQFKQTLDLELVQMSLDDIRNFLERSTEADDHSPNIERCQVTSADDFLNVYRAVVSNERVYLPMC